MTSAKRETLLLIPGLLCDAIVWRDQEAALGRAYGVHIADLTSFSSLDVMAMALLERVHGPLSVAGHSMGARVALQMIHYAPERIARIALLDTGVEPVGPDEQIRRQVLVDLGRREGMRALADAWLPPMLAPGALQANPTLRDALYAMVERMTPDIHRRQIAALLGRPDAHAVLGRIRCPALVGVGDRDAWSPPPQHRAIADAIHDSHYVVFPDSGHMAPMEAPDAVTAALAAWMLRPAGNVERNDDGR